MPASVDLVDVVLPAAGRIAPPFSTQVGTEVKALIQLEGATLLARLIGALRASDRVGRIVVIGPREVADHPDAALADALLPDAGSGPANVFAGLHHLAPDVTSGNAPARRVMIAATDLPFVTPHAVGAFLDACPAGADISLGVVGREPFEAQFPDIGGTWVRLRDGEWTLGCAFLVDPVAAQRARPHMERVFEARKSQWQMARLLGPLFVARWLGRRLSIAHVEERCATLLGCQGAAVVAAPAWGFDLDTQDEYHHAQRLLARQPPA